jgi:ligand-binding sensor domain-containing protein
MSDIPIGCYISCFLVDETSIWLSASSPYHGIFDGLLKYDQSRKWMKINTSSSPFPKSAVNNIEIDKTGTIWLSCGESLINIDDEEWTIYDTTNSELANCIAFDNNDVKWIGTPEGLVKFDGYDWVMFNKYNSGLPCNIITCITIDDADNIWIVTGSDCLDKC